jgi:predicted ATPase
MIQYVRFKSFPNQNYPFNIPAFSSLDKLDLSQPITIFVGDNGSGKSTLLKAIAYYNSSINVSAQGISSSYYQEIQTLSSYMECAYDYKTRRGFFFSGEEFITYINHLKHMKQELVDELKRIDEVYKDKSAFAKSQARMAPAGQLAEMNQMYGGDLKTKSHGEGFLTFFKERMHQKGIYLLDEPETPLSAINQYQLVVMITDLIKNGSQVIIATHSPIIMALKDAKIYYFGKNQIEAIQYDDIESVNFTKNFLNHKDQFINRLEKREEH